MIRPLAVAVLALVVASTGGAAQKKPVARALSTGSLSGQSVAVLPITMVIAEPGLAAGAAPSGHQALIAWADSLVSEAFTSRGPDIRWKLPPELRRVAKRGAGYVPEPDFMGQSILRTWGIVVVPDPLRGNLRRLSAIVGDRLVMVPASIILRPLPNDSARAELSAAMVDTRLGRVIWRTFISADGATPAGAVEQALAIMLPVEGSSQ